MRGEPKYIKLYYRLIDKYRDVVEFVKEYYERTAPIAKTIHHPWNLPQFKIDHILRVLRYSLMLSTKRNVDFDVITLAALMHDLALYTSGRRNHAIESSKVAEKYLHGINYPKEIKEKVVRAIAVHSGPLAFEANTLEEKILQDADTIDKVGAFGITAFLLYCGSRKYTPKQSLDEIKKVLFPKLKWHYRTMHTPEGKRMVKRG